MLGHAGIIRLSPDDEVELGLGICEGIETGLHHLLARRFAVPKLQRNFVRDAGRAVKLLDSIYREMPIYGYSDCHMSCNYG